MNNTQNLPTIYINKEVALPDNYQWRYRFKVESASSNRLYTISQHKTKKHWGCNCMGWKRFRKCHHLEALGIPNYEKPYEVNVITR